jgi:hypothetical protein
MLAAHTAIYTASDDETLVKLSVGVVALGRDLARVASAIPFDPAAYETLRSMFERTFRALRQRARALSDLPAVTGAPTNETSDGLCDRPGSRRLDRRCLTGDCKVLSVGRRRRVGANLGFPLTHVRRGHRTQMRVRPQDLERLAPIHRAREVRRRS